MCNVLDEGFYNYTVHWCGGVAAWKETGKNFPHIKLQHPLATGSCLHIVHTLHECDTSIRQGGHCYSWPAISWVGFIPTAESLYSQCCLRFHLIGSYCIHWLEKTMHCFVPVCMRWTLQPIAPQKLCERNESSNCFASIRAWVTCFLWFSLIVGATS